MKKKSSIGTRCIILAAILAAGSATAGHADSLRAAAARESASDIATVTRWIGQQQFTKAGLASFGALKVHPTPGAVGSDGKAYYRVVPYSANLAVLGLLRARSAGCLATAEAWISWYENHLTLESAPDGVPLEHFYLADGSGETSCINANDPRFCHYNDATDSAAATFFAVLWAYHRAGGNKAFLRAPRRQATVRKLEKVLMALKNPDGLFWAKRDYRVKYLEDNCEVFAGLMALAQIEAKIFGDPQRAALFAQAASKLQRGVSSELFDAKSGLYRNAKFENNSFGATDLTRWEMGVQAQFWPHLWGVAAPSDCRSQRVISLVNAQWSGENLDRNWPSVAANADVAYAALLAGDKGRAKRYLQTIKTLKLPDSNRLNAFAWPFNIASAGWLLDTLTSARL